MDSDILIIEKEATELFQQAVNCLKKGDYKSAMITFVALHDSGFNREEIFDIITEAYYKPSLVSLHEQYNKNINILSKYPYIMKRNFPAFGDLSLRFYPIDGNMFMEYFVHKHSFGNVYTVKESTDYKKYKKEIYKPLIIKQEFDINQIKQTCDKYMKSEEVKEDNHIYLYYENFNLFCSYLQIVDIAEVLKNKKVVLIFGEEQVKEYYPIDFNKVFGIDFNNMSSETIESIELFVSCKLNKNYEKLIGEAIQDFEAYNYKDAILKFAALVNNNYSKRDILNTINEAYYEPNRKLLMKQYNKNTKSLKEYPYMMKKEFPDFEELQLKLCPIAEDLYIEYLKKEKAFGKIYHSKALKEDKHFFKDLSKQLLIKDEFNINNIKYLYDNIRKSENYGDDNHIYLHYSNFNVFCTYLQVMDFEQFLQDEKLVFIFEEEQLYMHYPLNFKKMFNIDYSNVKSKPISINEVKRIFLGLPLNGLSGSMFLENIVDFHPQILTIGVFGLSGFGILYERLLANMSVKEAIHKIHILIDSYEDKVILEEINRIFSTSENLNENKNSLKVLRNIYVPEIDNFLFYLEELLINIEIPTKSQWFKGFYLAYAYALNRNLDSRICPAIFFHPHDGIYILANECIKQMSDVINSFEYSNAISIVRNLTTVLGSTINTYIENNHIYVMNMILETEELYTAKQYKQYEKRAIVRFEDLKLNSKATLISLCKYFDITWDDSLLETTSNGANYQYHLANTKTKGFDTKPVYKLYEEYLSFFDKYRIEMIKSKYYEPYGYKPKYYDENYHSLIDILKMFEMPFKFEKYHNLQSQINMNNSAREKLYKTVLKLINEPIPTNNGKSMEPIKWLKPEEELIEVPLYE